MQQLKNAEDMKYKKFLKGIMERNIHFLPFVHYSI